MYIFRTIRLLCKKKNKIPQTVCKSTQSDELREKTIFFPITHCIFDLDSIILDTASIYHEIIRDILAEYGFQYTSEMHNRILGASSRETCNIAIQHYKLPISPDNLLEKYRSICKERVKNCALAPGVRQLILHLHNLEIPLCIATSSNREMMEYKINHLSNFFKMFHHILTDDDVLRNKPEPDIYLICAKRFPGSPSTSRCLVFSHSPLGMVAALRAGMQCVVIADRMVPPLSYRRATVVLDSLEEFDPEWFGIPKF